MFVGLKRISIALGLLAAMPIASQAQSMIPGTNQATADAVAGTLRASRALSGHRIEIQTTNGLVTLSGQVANPAQKAEAVARARSVVGVNQVNDQIQVAGDRGVLPVQYQQVALGHHGGHAGGHGGVGMGGGVVMDGAAMGGAPAGEMMMDGPMPEGAAGGTMAPAGGNGGPNYAWPSYAPRDNFSAVGYPTVYPWQAWPNIGPPYPYPEVPLDWRAVTLRWDDGIWWLDFKKHYTRPFFTPYPFGIFAY
jgi:hypothetical protein